MTTYRELKIKEAAGLVSVGDPRTGTKANLNSPTLTGTPAAPTAAAGTNTTQIATTAYVRGEVSALVDAAPETLNTLNELAAALGDNANYAASVTTALGLKADASSLTTHTGASTSVHGISNTANLVYTADSRLSDTRTPADNSVTSAKIVDGAIVNADINASAAIAATKISGTAVITTDSRLSDTRTPTDNSVTSAKIVDGTIVNADINASAAIAQSKISGLSTDLAAKATFIITRNPQTVSYTLALTDVGSLVEMGSASVQTLTVPTNAVVAFAVGTKIDVLQTGAGVTTIAGASGVTVNSEGGKLKINAQWQTVSLVKRATDTWVLIGALKT